MLLHLQRLDLLLVGLTERLDELLVLSPGLGELLLEFSLQTDQLLLVLRLKLKLLLLNISSLQLGNRGIHCITQAIDLSGWDGAAGSACGSRRPSPGQSLLHRLDFLPQDTLRVTLFGDLLACLVLHVLQLSPCIIKLRIQLHHPGGPLLLLVREMVLRHGLALVLGLLVGLGLALRLHDLPPQVGSLLVQRHFHGVPQGQEGLRQLLHQYIQQHLLFDWSFSSCQILSFHGLPLMHQGVKLRDLAAADLTVHCAHEALRFPLAEVPAGRLVLLLHVVIQLTDPRGQLGSGLRVSRIVGIEARAVKNGHRFLLEFLVHLTQGCPIHGQALHSLGIHRFAIALHSIF
mmetsp:Transcript_24225/g.55329  ORF Transcript_24225/g.55329 Transcript_24225/m.55329 type:complete len:346 (+) Transcript_24225:354-1391(+)